MPCSRTLTSGATWHSDSRCSGRAGPSASSGYGMRCPWCIWGGWAGRRLTQLSGGQQQRVALARALVIAPELLLLDEPLSNLDAVLRVAMRDEIRSLQRRTGTTTVFVTHDRAEALYMADQVAVLADGRVQQVGT